MDQKSEINSKPLEKTTKKPSRHNKPQQQKLVATDPYIRSDQQLLDDVRRKIHQEKFVTVDQKLTSPLHASKRLDGIEKRLLEQRGGILNGLSHGERTKFSILLHEALMQREQSIISVVENLAKQGILQSRHVTPEGRIRIDSLDPETREKYKFLAEYQLGRNSRLRQRAKQEARQANSKVLPDKSFPQPTIGVPAQTEIKAPLEEIQSTEPEETSSEIQPPVYQTTERKLLRFPNKVRKYWRNAVAAALTFFGTGQPALRESVSTHTTSEPSGYHVHIDQTPSAKAAAELVLHPVPQALETKSIAITPNETQTKPLAPLILSQESLLPPINEVVTSSTLPQTVEVNTIEHNLEIPITPETSPKPHVLSITGGKEFSFNQAFGHTQYAKKGAYSSGIHNGWDLGVPSGTEIFAPITGEIVVATLNNGTFGGSVVIRSEDGTYYLFAHMKEIDLKVGMVVNTGELMGLSGGGPKDEGKGYSTGAHLHFGIYTVGPDGSVIYDNPGTKYDRTGVPINISEAGHDFENDENQDH